MPAACARSVSVWKYSFKYTLSYKVFAKLCNTTAVVNIVFCCLPAFQTEGKVYLILDFLRGGDLFTRLSKEVSQNLLLIHRPV